MKIFAISGSTRERSTNTALLRALQSIAPDGIDISIFEGLGDIPIFSPDLEGPNLPASVRTLMQMIADSDGVLISSPEYIRSIPGGLKNAIDWLVSGDHVIGKRIALVHASHRGDDMLASLRTVLSTVSSGFNKELFFRLPVMNETQESIQEVLQRSDNRQMAERFLRDFSSFCRDSRYSNSDATVA